MPGEPIHGGPGAPIATTTSFATTPSGRALLLLLFCGAVSAGLNLMVLGIPSNDPRARFSEAGDPPLDRPPSIRVRDDNAHDQHPQPAQPAQPQPQKPQPQEIQKPQPQPQQTPPQQTRSPPVKPAATSNDEEIRERLKDPSHTPRLTKGTAGEGFPTPVFHGCTEGGTAGLCRFSNVCYSRRDHMLVMETDRVGEPGVSFEDGWYEPTSAFSENLVPLRKPQLVPRSVHANLTNVYWADSLLAMNCWQQHQEEKNPAHFIMGMGKLFVHSTGYWDTPIPPHNNTTSTTSKLPHETLDLLLYHQCAPVEGWDWAEYVRDIVWKQAIANRSIEGSLADASMYLTYVDDGPDLLQDDVVVCGKTVYQEPFTSGLYFSGNKRPVINQWQAAVEEKVARDPGVPPGRPPKDPRSLPSNPKQYDQRYCIDHLQIAALQRTEGTSLRLFQNLDEVATIAEQYTKEPFFVIQPNSSMSPSEQVGLFRSFDVLLTPHGSHNVNMIFGGGHSCFVEASAVYYDPGPRANGFAFSKWWYHSFGHEPVDNPELAAKLPACLATGDIGSPQDLHDPNCPLFPTRLAFIHSDLVLNTTTIRHHLEKAIYTLCPGPSQMEDY